MMDSSGLRLQTTIQLRWAAVVGQTFTVFVVYWGLAFDFPIALCLMVIGLSAFLNIALNLRFPASKRLSSGFAMPLLGYDILQLATLLYLTGGLQNPFALLIVVPVAVSASNLSLQSTSILVALAIACVTILVKLHLPVPWAQPGGLELPEIYLAGMWFALVSCIAFSAVYAWWVGQERWRMSKALAAAELVLAREQKLSALDGLAAAAAHELGTPLSTITVIAKELLKDLPEQNPWREDIALLYSQAGRCREILSRLAGRGDAGDEVFERMSLPQLIEEAIAPYRQSGVKIMVRLMPKTGADGKRVAEPVLRRNPGIIYGLSNLVENAVDFARHSATIEARWDETCVSVTIADDGPGFPPNIMSRLGEPYVTTRPATGRLTEADHAGLGLGFFIAKTLLERSGARLELKNQTPPKSGALIRIVWPRHMLDQSVREKQEKSAAA